MALGPEYERLYLNDQLSEDHPEYARYHAMYKDSPAGKRLTEFKQQNKQMADGLNGKTPAQLDLIIRDESVMFTGQFDDRIGKIMAIRKHRISVEKEKIREMTPEQRKEYLAQKHQDEIRRAPSMQQISDHEKEVQTRAARSGERQTELDKLRLKRQQQREAERAAGRAYLDEEAARRGKVDPAALRKAAMERAEKDAEEIVQDDTETGLEGVELETGYPEASGSETTQEGGEEGHEDHEDAAPSTDAPAGDIAPAVGDGAPAAPEAAPPVASGESKKQPAGKSKSQQRREATQKKNSAKKSSKKK